VPRRHLAGEQVEIGEPDDDLAHVDPGDPELLGERLQRVDLADRAAVDEGARERHASAGRGEREVELAPVDDAVLEEDLTDRLASTQVDRTRPEP
jgi:hypothetical protein